MWQIKYGFLQVAFVTRDLHLRRYGRRQVGVEHNLFSIGSVTARQEEFRTICTGLDIGEVKLSNTATNCPVDLLE